MGVGYPSQDWLVAFHFFATQTSRKQSSLCRDCLVSVSCCSPHEDIGIHLLTDICDCTNTDLTTAHSRTRTRIDSGDFALDFANFYLELY